MLCSEQKKIIADIIFISLKKSLTIYIKIEQIFFFIRENEIKSNN